MSDQQARVLVVNPPDYLLTEALRHGFSNVDDVLWTHHPIPEDVPDYRRQSVTCCAPREESYSPVGVPITHRPIAIAVMYPHVIKRSSEINLAWLGQCPSCQTIYWHLQTFPLDELTT